MSKKKTQNNGMAAFNDRQRIKNLATEYSLDDHQIRVALERYVQHETALDEARKRPEAITVTVLPGTAVTTPNVERLALVERAIELGIHSGHYEEWELLQFGNFIIGLRDEQHLDWYLDLLKYTALGSDLQRRLDIITIQVLRSPGNLWIDLPHGGKRFLFSETDAGQLMKLFTELHIIAERLEIDPTTIPPVFPFVDGIRALVNEKDRGQALRDAIDAYDPAVFESIQTYAEMQPKAGAKPKGVIDRLCARAKPYIGGGLPYGKTFDQMVNDLNRAGLNRLEQEEADKLKNWSVESFEKAYRLRMGKQITSVT